MTQQLEHEHTDTSAQPDALEAALDDAVEVGNELDHFRRRVVQDALVHGLASYWRQRAATFEEARPRPGDHIGTAGQQRVDQIDADLVATRDACLHRAALATMTTDLDLT